MDLNPPILIGFALADSFNPVVFGVLIIILTQHKTNKFSIIKSGITYTAGYIITSFVVGLLFLTSYQLLITALPAISKLLGLIITSMGLVELLKTTKYAKSKYIHLSLLNHKHRLSKFKAKSYFHPTLIFSAGSTVCLYEIFFSRGVYLGTLATSNHYMLAQNTLHMLALYHLIMIIPLAIITTLLQYNLSIKPYSLWQPKYHSQIHLGIALLTIILGIYLLL